MLTKIGKNAITAHTATFDRMLVTPKRLLAIGAMAMIGAELMTRAIASTAPRSEMKRDTTVAIRRRR